MTFEIFSTSIQSEIPEELINLLAANFSNIKDRGGFESYFFKKHLNNPILNWMKCENKIIGFYSLFEYQFKYNGVLIKTGKPELNLITKEFLRYCIDNKINYEQVNPLNQLTDKVFEQSKKNGLSFLFTWPNNISLQTYIRNNYKIREISTEYYIKVLDKSFFKKYLKNKFFKYFLSFFNWVFKINLPAFDRIKLEETSGFDIEKFNIEKSWETFCSKNSYNLYYYKTNEIVNKKFSEEKFIKYWVKYNNEITGYIVVKKNNNRIYISDYILNYELIYKVLKKLKFEHEEAIMFLKYYNKEKELNKFKMLLNGFFCAKIETKKLAYNVLDGYNLQDFDENTYFDQFVSDFSV